MSEINGLIRASNALHYWERRQEIASNNLANSDTAGFKAERVFARVIGDQVPVADTATDLTVGSITETGEALDLAMADGSFFVVQTPDGERLSRGGSFTIDAQNRIVDAAGNPLLGEGGEIVVKPGSIDIDSQGSVRIEGEDIAQLRVMTVPPNTQLTHVGGTLFLPDAAQADVPPGERKVLQGKLEGSNVNTIDSLVDLISIQRNYAAVQRAVTTIDGIRGTIANDLGKVV